MLLVNIQENILVVHQIVLVNEEEDFTEEKKRKFFYLLRTRSITFPSKTHLVHEKYNIVFSIASFISLTICSKSSCRAGDFRNHDHTFMQKLSACHLDSLVPKNNTQCLRFWS